MQLQTFTFNFVEEHTYILWDETCEACIIDAGMSTEEECGTVLDFLHAHQLRLTKAIHTHLHFDHYLGATWVRNTLGIDAEAPAIDIREKLALSGVFTRGNEVLRSYVESSQFVPLPEQGGSVKFGNSSLSILSVPGHTPGHVAFYSELDSIVFVGDVLFKGDIGRTDLWMGDYNQLLDSIHNQLFTLPPETKVYSGHGPSTTILEEKRTFRYS